MSLATPSVRHAPEDAAGTQRLREGSRVTSQAPRVAQSTGPRPRCTGDLGLVALGVALKTNRTLTALRIDHNGLGIDGLKAITLALKSNKKVRA